VKKAMVPVPRVVESESFETRIEVARKEFGDREFTRADCFAGVGPGGKRLTTYSFR